MGTSPPSARVGVRSHCAALSALPIISTAVAYTRANRTVRSDSAAVRRECRLRRRVKVRCGMPSFSESAAFFRSSFSPSTMREPEGRPLRISSASSAKLLIVRPRTFLPPRTSAITAEVILSLLAIYNTPIGRRIRDAQDAAHRVAPQATADLDGIWYYGAKESGSVEIANHLIDSITERFNLLVPPAVEICSRVVERRNPPPKQSLDGAPFRVGVYATPGPDGYAISRAVSDSFFCGADFRWSAPFT